MDKDLKEASKQPPSSFSSDAMIPSKESGVGVQKENQDEKKHVEPPWGRPLPPPSFSSAISSSSSAAAASFTTAASASTTKISNETRTTLPMMERSKTQSASATNSIKMDQKCMDNIKNDTKIALAHATANDIDGPTSRGGAKDNDDDDQARKPGAYCSGGSNSIKMDQKCMDNIKNDTKIALAHATANDIDGPTSRGGAKDNDDEDQARKPGAYCSGGSNSIKMDQKCMDNIKNDTKIALAHATANDIDGPTSRGGAKDNDDEDQARKPGAYCSGGSTFQRDRTQENDESTILYDGAMMGATAPKFTEEEDEMYEVKAQLVEEDTDVRSSLTDEYSLGKKMNESIPMAEVADTSKNRRMVRGLILALVLAIIVAIVVGVTTTKTRRDSNNNNNSMGRDQGGIGTDPGPRSAPPSNIPSRAPSPAPTLFPSFKPTATPWTMGQEIEGEEFLQGFGYSVELSDDGLTLAVSESVEYGGMVSIYRWNSNTWNSLGEGVMSNTNETWFGVSLALSGDGSTVAVGSAWNEMSPLVEIFRFFSNSWFPIGRLPNVGHGAFQESVALSRNGRIVAVGSPFNSTVQVFERINMTNTWARLGSEIAGRLPSDEFGQSVDLSSDGLILLVGAPGINDTVGGGEANVTGTPQTGYARAYEYSYDTDEWTQLGTDTMLGLVPGDQTGWTVAISGDGQIAAVGAILNDVSGENAGTVRVFKYNTDSLSWLPYGSTIEGEAALDNSGWSLDMSTDGSTIVIGAPGNKGRPQDDDNPINYNAGHARVYEYSGDTGSNTGGGWVQVGADLDGELARDQSGYNVAISSDGSVVAVGAPFNNGNANIDAGQVRIFYAP